MLYYLEYTGGLGDIFNQMYSKSSYRGLADLWEDDEAIIAVFSHNPFAWELFEWHPKRPQLTIRQHSYGEADELERNRHTYSLGGIPLESTRERVAFYPSPADLLYLRDLPIEEAVVISPTAGLPDRSIPQTTVDDVIGRLVESGMPVIIVGRTYERFGRLEYHPPRHPQVHDLIDALSVPGVAEIVRRARGLVTCHSALNILAWHLKTPQLLLYPPSVYHRHFARGRDDWSFGLDWNITVHALFEGYSPTVFERFRGLVGGNRSVERAPGTQQ